jgi:hypothetical protein
MSGVTGAQAVGRDESVRLSEDGDRYRLDVLRAGPDDGAPPTVRRRIWFERRNLLVVEEQRLSPSGEVEATMQFDDYRLVGAEGEAGVPTITAPTDKRLRRPFKISMKDGQSPGNIQVTFLELIPNEPIKPGELGHV